MKKQPRAITTRAWTARWMVMAYLLTLFHWGLLPHTWATEEQAYIPAVGDSVDIDVNQDDNQDSQDNPENPENSDTESPEESPPTSPENQEDNQGETPEESEESEELEESEENSDDSAPSQEEQDEEEFLGNGEEPSMFADNQTGTLTINLPDGAASTVTITERHYKYADGVATLTEGRNASFQMDVNVNGTETQPWFYRQVEDETETDPTKQVYSGYSTTISTTYNNAGSTSLVLNGIIPSMNSTDDSIKDRNYDYVTYEVLAFRTSQLTLIHFANGSIVTFENSSSLQQTMEGSTVTANSTSKRETDTTFLTAINTLDDEIKYSYDMTFFLNYYNTVSLNNIESTHIIGPIIALGHAARMGYSASTQTGGQLAFSERSKGFSSYVGTMVNDPSNQFQSALMMGYFYDEEIYNEDTSLVPNLYIGYGSHNVVSLTQNYTTRDYIAPITSTGSFDSVAFPSPNYDGLENKVYQNETDSFMDVTALTNAMTTASDTLTTHGVITGTSRQGTDDYITVNPSDIDNGTYTVTHGKSYIFYNNTASKSPLQKIIIDFTNSIGYTSEGEVDGPFIYGVHADNNPTTITFAKGSLPEDFTETYEIFPDIWYIDSENKEPVQLETPEQGQGGEYFDLGNKVIWNLPNSPRVCFAQQGINIIGHMIAPNSTITNYNVSYSEGSGTWTVNPSSFSGGNINGAMIAKDIYSGTTEFHYWPYMTELEIEESTKEPTAYAISGTKNAVGGSPEGFSFTLTDNYTTVPNYADYGFDKTNESDGYTMPSVLTVQSDETGTFTMEEIEFTSEGTYYFYLYEDTSEENNPWIQYDESVYMVTIPVEEIDSVLTVGNPTATQYSPSTGATQSNFSQSGDNLGIVFVNSYVTVDLPETGGQGTAVYYGLGLGLVCLAFVLTQPNRKETLL